MSKKKDEAKLDNEGRPRRRRKGLDFSKLSLLERVKTAAQALLGFKETTLAFNLGRDKEGEIGFRRLTARSDKDLTPASWQKQMAVAHFLYLQNPMAWRILELIADFVVGGGFLYKAHDEEVDKIIERFWNDPDNNLDLSQFDRYIELITFGTYAPRAFVNPVNGHVKLSPVDPAWIVEVVPDPDMPGKARTLLVNRFRQGGQENDQHVEKWKVIHENTDRFVAGPDDESGMSTVISNPAFGLLDGDAFYFTVNRLTFLVHGISDLFRVADWLDVFDQFVFSQLERSNFLNAHLWDIEVEGAEQTEIDDIIEELETDPPKPGSFRVHNEKMKWTVNSPDLGASDAEAVSSMIKMLILGSVGIPLHWFADGGDVNRATAAEMGGPIHRKMKRKQAQWIEVLRTMVQFQIDQAIKAGRLSVFMPQGSVDDEGNDISGKKRDMSFEIIPPDIDTKDMTAFIDSLGKLTTALGDAVIEGFIDRKRAAEVWSAHASESGVEVESPNQEQVDKNVQDVQDVEGGKEKANAAEPYKDQEKKKFAAEAVAAGKKKVALKMEQGNLE